MFGSETCQAGLGNAAPGRGGPARLSSGENTPGNVVFEPGRVALHGVRLFDPTLPEPDPPIVVDRVPSTVPAGVRPWGRATGLMRCNARRRRTGLGWQMERFDSPIPVSHPLAAD